MIDPLQHHQSASRKNKIAAESDHKIVPSAGRGAGITTHPALYSL